LILRNLGFMAIPLNGEMSQNKRLSSLNKFRARTRSILVCNCFCSDDTEKNNITKQKKTIFLVSSYNW
jgi:hypothetical protein